jgi:hypothetical protein
MNPVIIHADGTDCGHEGTLQATLHMDGGPRCPAGQPVTHVRFGGTTLTIEQAYASLKQVADAWAKAITPILSALAEFGRKLSAEPSIRALAAAAKVVDEERQREDADRG